MGKVRHKISALTFPKAPVPRSQSEPSARLTMVRLSGFKRQLGRGASVGSRSNNKFKEDICLTPKRGFLEPSCMELAESAPTC